MLAALALLLALPSAVFVFRTINHKPLLKPVQSHYRPLLEQGVALNEALVKARFKDFYVVQELIDAAVGWEQHVDKTLTQAESSATLHTASEK